MGSFGNKFRRARESKKLSLDDVSNVTKIGSRMLKAIEEEDFDQLPGGVFNKGFIRAYAKQLGLDPEEAVSDYLACSQAQVSSPEGLDSERRSGSDRRKVVAPASSKNAPKSEPSVEVEEELPHLHLPRAEDIRSKPKEYLDRPSSGIPWLTIAIILVITSAAALFWVRHTRRERAAKVVAPQMTTIETPPSGSSVVLPQSVSEQTAMSASPALGGESRSATTKLENGAQKSTTTRNNAPGPTATANSSQTNTAKNTSLDAGPAPTTSPKPAGKLSLVIRANENSWISVTSDGQTVTQETLIAPAHTTVHADREITVRVGNAAGVTFSWNGQEIPAQGAEAEVKTLIFDSEGIHSPAATPN